MGVRAVIVVRDETGHERRFRSGWASTQFQIPHLARFVHTADRDGTPLSVAGYLDYVATHPHTLPGHDITGQRGHHGGRGADEVGDLDHRYELHLNHSERAFRYLVYDRSPDDSPGRAGWRRREDLHTRAQLYAAAARMCRELAANTQRHQDANHGVGPPGWPSPQDWQDEAAQFLRWRDAASVDTANRSNGSQEPVAPWYAVRAARAQARQITTRLRHHYPGLNIRCRVSPDGVISLTVPAELATDAEAARIAGHLADVCGHTFTVAVRPHRPSRYSVHNGQTPPQPQQQTEAQTQPQVRTRPRVNATLTLRPNDHPAVPRTARDAAPGSAQRNPDGNHTAG